MFTIGPRATLADVVSAMVEHNCGSLVVCEADKVVGIITERDILRACAAQNRPLVGDARRGADDAQRDHGLGERQDQ